ncbi:MAG TPA: hypothetical protein VIM33_00970 [Gaiellaceae bacterium]|jgi:hypothetical protein
MLDLSQFASCDDAFEKVEPGDRYLKIAMLQMPVGPDERMPITLTSMFWTSMINRSEGLHQAISREIRQGNPHAVYPLIRALAESVVLVIYVMDHPEYVPVLTTRPKELPSGSPKRKSPQALISYASSHAPGMKEVYAELSEATHFGAPTAAFVVALVVLLV